MNLGVPSVHQLSVMDDRLSAIVASSSPNNDVLNAIVGDAVRTVSILPS
ncbi:hypothetical protein [Stenomitos frigidus]|nr:hypothetical protein [Stenomitos frigidus]